MNGRDGNEGEAAMSDATTSPTDDQMSKLGARIQGAAAAVGVILTGFVVIRTVQVFRFPEYFEIAGDEFFLKAQRLTAYFSGDVLIGLLVAAFAIHIGGWFAGGRGSETVPMVGRMTIMASSILVGFMNLFVSGYILTNLDSFTSAMSGEDIPKEIWIEQSLAALLIGLISVVTIALVSLQSIRAVSARRARWDTPAPDSTQSSSDTEANATDANGAESGIPASFGSTDTAVVDMVGVDAQDVDDEEAIVTETVALTFDDDAPDSGLAAETGADESADAAQDGESEEATGEGAQSDGDSADDAEDAGQGDGDNDGASDADSKDADSKD